jgi:hypothetical protein
VFGQAIEAVMQIP